MEQAVKPKETQCKYYGRPQGGYFPIGPGFLTYASVTGKWQLAVRKRKEENERRILEEENRVRFKEGFKKNQGINHKLCVGKKDFLW